MLITPILFTLSYIFSGWLQYFGRFLAYSLAPVLYNLGIILGIIFFVPILGINGLAWGVVLGAFLFLLIQIVAAKTMNYHYSPIFNLKNFGIKKTIQLMVPSSLGNGLSQANLIVITALASTLSFGSLTIFTFSRNIYSLPASMIGAPFAIAIFPILSKKWHMGLKKEFLDNFSLALKQVLFLTIPLSILMFLLRAQIVRIILGAGLWGWQETRLAAGSLGILSFSIFAYSIIPVFQKAFYSLQDTKTPTLLQVLACALSIISSIIFLFLLKFPNIFNRNLANLLKLRGIDNIQVIAFSLAFAISNFFQAIFLFLIFIRKIDLKGLRWFFSSLKNILIISFLMAGAVKIILVPLADIFPLTTFFGVLAQTIFAFLFAVLVYIFLAIILRMPEFYTLIDSILKK